MPVTLVIPVPNIARLNPKFADKHSSRTVADLIRVPEAEVGYQSNMASTGERVHASVQTNIQTMTGAAAMCRTS